MELMVLGSSSKGNCYLLKTSKEVLILEAGISLREIKKALGFNLSKVVGCLVTHEHLDDCKAVKALVESGIDMFMSAGTKSALKQTHHRIKTVVAFDTFEIGGFTVLPFQLQHNSTEPLGYVIHHEEMGSVVFASETSYVSYRFENISHLMVECNYSLDILNKNVETGLISSTLRDRLIRSHFELGNVKKYIKDNFEAGLKNIILLDLSQKNSNALDFKAQVEALNLGTVSIATKGVRLKF